MWHCDGVGGLEKTAALCIEAKVEGSGNVATVVTSTNSSFRGTCR